MVRLLRRDERKNRRKEMSIQIRCTECGNVLVFHGGREDQTASTHLKRAHGIDPVPGTIHDYFEDLEGHDG